MQLVGRTLWFAILVAASTARAEWTGGSFRDAMSDETRVFAKLENAEGHSVTIYRDGAGAVWFNFALSDAHIGQISYQRAIMYRVDANRPHDGEDVRRLQSLVPDLGVQYQWKPRWVHWKLWSGKPAMAGADKVLELAEGERLLVRFLQAGGGAHDVYFELGGGVEALRTVVDLQAARVSASALEDEVARRTRCQSNAVNEDYSACMSRMQPAAAASAPPTGQ